MTDWTDFRRSNPEPVALDQDWFTPDPEPTNPIGWAVVAILLIGMAFTCAAVGVMS